MLEIKIVALVGVVGSGKSFRQIEYQENNYKPINFADAAKEFLWSTLKWKPSDITQERDFKDSYSLNINNKGELVSSISGREFLINFTQNMKSLVNQDIWAENTILKIKRNINNGFDKFVVGDLRFENEISALKNLKHEREKEFGDIVDLQFIFCNYKSKHYKIIRDSVSEKLSLSLLDKNFQDGEIINIF